MNMEKIEQAKEMLVWIANNGEKMELILEVIKGESDPSHFLEVMQSLKENELYQIIILLFLCWEERRCTSVTDFIHQLAIERLSESWEQEVADKLIKVLSEDMEEYMGENL